MLNKIKFFFVTFFCIVFPMVFISCKSSKNDTSDKLLNFDGISDGKNKKPEKFSLKTVQYPSCQTMSFSGKCLAFGQDMAVINTNDFNKFLDQLYSAIPINKSDQISERNEIKKHLFSVSPCKTWAIAGNCLVYDLNFSSLTQLGLESLLKLINTSLKTKLSMPIKLPYTGTFECQVWRYNGNCAEYVNDMVGVSQKDLNKFIDDLNSVL